MKIIDLKCPHCQAQMSLQEDKVRSQVVFCPYCGTKVILDDGVKRYEITKNINIKNETHVFDHIDDQSKTDIAFFKYFFLFMGIICIALMIIEGSTNGTLKQIVYSFTSSYDNSSTIAIPFSSSEIEKSSSNYEHYLEELQKAGFTNISFHENPDIVWGFTSEGTIDYISIDGLKKFETGNRYKPDVSIIISYHVKSK